jgi:hypothetical protein
MEYKGERMPVVPYLNQIEPSEEAVIWRFINLRKFRDLMASEELYFRRADLLFDKTEGLPLEQYTRRVLDPYDINDGVSLNNHPGFFAQNREFYYVTCWQLYGGETLNMWEQYGHDGVAVCSRYGLLKSAMDGLPDEAHVGLVRYGTAHLENTFNALEFITAKQLQYSEEREVRAWLTSIDPLAGGNWQSDLNGFPHPMALDLNPRHSWVPDCQRRRIDLRALLTDIVISPWAEGEAVEEIKLWVSLKGFPNDLKYSELISDQAPTLEKFRAARHLVSSRMPEPEFTEKRLLTKEELGPLFRARRK